MLILFDILHICRVNLTNMKNKQCAQPVNNLEYEDNTFKIYIIYRVCNVILKILNHILKICK